MTPTLDDLRRHALARSLFTALSLPRALARLGFVQADPIRAPARAQDLVLFQRVAGYRAGDLEARYPKLELEEDYFVNYGFVPRALHERMHPRTARQAWTPARWKQAQAVHDFVREQGVAHPREVDARFAHGKTTNWFGGSSNASTQLLDGMHYRGLLRVARRVGGTRCYAAHDAHLRSAPDDAAAAMDALLDVAVALYAPLPARTLGWLASALAGYGAPQWQAERSGLLARAKQRLPQARVEGIDWYWPAGENPAGRRHRTALEEEADRVRLLAPFDPVVWDRTRFEAFWGWAYRFEAYTPAPKRKLGYYALPLLWRGRVIGWGNLAVEQDRLVPQLGWVSGKPPREAAFRNALDEELARCAAFLGLPGPAGAE